MKRNISSYNEAPKRRCQEGSKTTEQERAFEEDANLIASLIHQHEEEYGNHIHHGEVEVEQVAVEDHQSIRLQNQNFSQNAQCRQNDHHNRIPLNQMLPHVIEDASTTSIGENTRIHNRDSESNNSVPQSYIINTPLNENNDGNGDDRVWLRGPMERRRSRVGNDFQANVFPLHQQSQNGNK